jgi:hypothetical protein
LALFAAFSNSIVFTIHYVSLLSENTSNGRNEHPTSSKIVVFRFSFSDFVNTAQPSGGIQSAVAVRDSGGARQRFSTQPVYDCRTAAFQLLKCQGGVRLY